MTNKPERRQSHAKDDRAPTRRPRTRANDAHQPKATKDRESEDDAQRSQSSRGERNNR